METSKHMAMHLCLLRGFVKPEEIPCIHHLNSKHKKAGCSPQRKPLLIFCLYLFEEGGCQNTTKSHRKGKWKSTKVVQKVTTRREKPTAALLKSKWPRRQHGSRQCGLNPTPPLDPVLCCSTWISLAPRRTQPCPGWTQMFVFQLQRFTDLWRPEENIWNETRRELRQNCGRRYCSGGFVESLFMRCVEGCLDQRTAPLRHFMFLLLI